MRSGGRKVNPLDLHSANDGILCMCTQSLLSISVHFGKAPSLIESVSATRHTDGVRKIHGLWEGGSFQNQDRAVGGNGAS